MTLKLQKLSRVSMAFLMAMFSVWGWAQTPYPMVNGNYLENFDDIANWGADFASGTGANTWKSVEINSSGTIPDGKKTTKSSSSWVTSSTGGMQKGAGSLVFLSTGATVNGEAVAADLLLDFAGRIAGTMSFDWATIASGTRPTSLRVYWSIDGITFTEFTGAQILDKVSPNSGSITSLALPTQFNDSSTARIRFYNHAGGSAGSGARNKISIDNLSITSLPGSTPTIYTTTSTALSSFSGVFGSAPTDVRSFSTNAENLNANLVVTPPSNWEISLSQNSGFTTNAIALSPSSNNVAQTNIYVRLANGAPIGSYSSNITLSSTGAATKNVSVSGNVNIAIPVSTSATNLNSTSFNANWNAVPGASGYFIDVYRIVAATSSENFSGGTTPPIGWVFSGIENYPSSGSNSSTSLKFADTNDVVTTKTYTNEITELKFWTQMQGGATSTLLVQGYDGVSWVTIENITNLSTSVKTYTYNSASTIPLPANLKQFKFTFTKNVGNLSLDDYSVIENQKNYVTGFNNKSLSNVQTTIVDNLTPATEYFYVVRSTNGTVTSANSNVISATTTLATTWNGTSWSNGNPSSTINAVIDGDYTGASFTANTITVNSTKTLTISSGQTVTTGNTTNNGNIIVNDGGNFIQTVGSAYIAGAGSSFVANRNSASAANKYVFWSSPVVDQNIFTAYTSGPSATTPTYVMTYNTGTNFYDLVTNTDNNFNANSGKGYSVKVPQTNAGLLFGGTNKLPNNGIVSVTLAGTTGGANYNLIGNPYPSNLDLNAFYTANNAAIESTLWFWDNTTGNVATQTGNTAVNVGYATVNLANPAGSTWVEAPGTQSPSYTTAALNAVGNVAKVGQGFIVKAKGAGQASFTNAMRSSANSVTLNKNMDPNTGKFWIKLTTSYGNTVTQAVTYNQGASDAYDVYDSKAMGMGSDAFYSLAGTEKLVIQGKSSFNINDVVPLGTKHFENGNFIVSLSHTEGLFTNGQAIYLHDKSTETYINLQNQTYTFTANAGEFANRFEIVYKLDVLATSETQKDTFEVYRDGEDYFVRNNKNIENIEVFDAAGRKVQSINNNSKLVRIKLESTGVYVIKAKSAGKEYSKKVIK